MIKAIIFDFDGVILESAIIKTEAFADVVKEYPKSKADEFVAYHMSHMGISRHIKFKYFIEEVLKESYTDEKGKELADAFEKIVYDRVMTCDFVPGAKEFLEKNYNKLDLYIASGTPHDEMKRIVKERDLEKFFKGVFGTPSKKTEIITQILNDNGYSKEEAVFVGDAETDMNAAKKIGLIFIGRSTSENLEAFRDVSYKINDLRQIEDILKEYS